VNRSSGRETKIDKANALCYDGVTIGLWADRRRVCGATGETPAIGYPWLEIACPCRWAALVTEYLGASPGLFQEACGWFFFGWKRRCALARKGDLNPVRHLNLGLDAELADALLASARKNERRLTEECRYAVRQYLKIDETPAEDNAGVSA
jgi:hypothetical protein